MYIVTTYWRSSLNIGNMRGFTDKAKAKAYWDQLVGADYVSLVYTRAYKLSDTDEPKILNTEKAWDAA